MERNSDNQWLEPLLAECLYREPVIFNFQQWSQRYPGEARILEQGFKDADQSHETKISNIWRLIMESKITRYSAAAVIVLAAALVLLGPFGTPGNGGVVLADVQKRVAGIETCIIRGTKTFTNPAKSDEVFEFAGIKMDFDLVKYFLKQYGLVEEGYVENELIYRITLNRPQKQALLILPRWKKYMLFNSTDKQMQQFFENVTPDGIVNLLLESKYKELGRDNIDGIDVEGFEFQNAERFKEFFPKALFNLQDAKGKVWIGIKEQLPVQVEGDMKVGRCIMTMLNDLNLHEFNTLGDYNIELDEDIFDINPPEGYTEFKLSDILQLIPVEAKAGLAGLGIVPIGLIFCKRHRRKKTIIQ
jgi:hypothetical protein